ncbi:MAG: hypothetical protein LBM09_00450 [Candidatus Nomurabacteria bacterium]|jgi:Fe-S-cluster containining protein|nr:hypothetical protein [Candidatus Nomurabacteria bacterium]
MASGEYLKKRQSLESADTEICSACGGACCKEASCAYAPADFYNEKGNFDSKILRRAILLGRACLAFDIDGYFVVAPSVKHVKNRGFIGEVCDVDDDGPCSLLQSNGCLIKAVEDRPFYAAVLQPDERGLEHCTQPPELAYMISGFEFDDLSWKNYQDVLCNLAGEFKKENQ